MMLPGVAQVIVGTIWLIATVTSSVEWLPGYSVLLLGTKVAEMVCDPAARVEVVKVARYKSALISERVPLPICVVPSKKSTVPPKTKSSDPGVCFGTTNAVKVIGWLTLALVGPDKLTVEVSAATA